MSTAFMWDHDELVFILLGVKQYKYSKGLFKALKLRVSMLFHTVFKLHVVRRYRAHNTRTMEDDCKSVNAISASHVKSFEGLVIHRFLTF